MMQWFTDQVILPMAAMLVTALIGFIAAKIAAWTGINIEAKHREALHSALMTGVRMALERLGPGANKVSLTSEAIRYAQGSVPDAIRRLGPDIERLEGMAEAKLQEALSQLQRQ